jgi:hypothetical protein
MPFKKTGQNEYTSPRGKKLTRKQVKAYYDRMGTKNPNSRHKKRQKN